MKQLAKIIRDQELNLRGAEFNHLALLLLRNGDDPLGALRMAEATKVVPDRVREILKSAVTAGSLSDAAWAGSLAPYQVLSSGFFEALRNVGCFDAMLQSMRQLPMRTTVASVTATATALEVDELKIKTISRFSLAAASLDERKVATFIVLSAELLQQAPAAMAFLGQELRNGVAAATDEIFLAELMLSVSPSPSAGSSATNILTDIDTLLEAIATGSASSLYLVVDQNTAKGLATKATSTGARAFEGMTPFGGEICGIPTLVSEVMPLSSGGSVALMCDASGIAAGSSVITLDTSANATIQMDQAPDDPVLSTSTLTSLWQQNKKALRAERYFGFEVVRANAVAALRGVNW